VTQDWHLSTIYQVQSGMPLTISVFGDTANSGTVLGENPIRATFTGPARIRPARTPPRNGLIPPHSLRPGVYVRQLQAGTPCMAPMQTLDFALARAFRISERTSFQFRAEAFNALNKVNLGTPNRYVNTPQFGTITMAMTPGREMQLSARLSF